MRALVTGGTGFIGRYVVKSLLDAGWEVECLTRRKIRPISPRVTCRFGDLLLPDTLRVEPDSIEKIDAVFHLAALIPSHSENSAEQYVQANTLGSAILLDAAIRLHVPVFINMSSISVATPGHPYAISKLAAELLGEYSRRSSNCRVVSLRLAAPYGPGMHQDTVLPMFVNAAISSVDLNVYGSGSRTQNFVHVCDAARACLRGAASTASGVFEIGGGASVSMSELAKMVVRLVPGCRSRIVVGERPDPQEASRSEVDPTSSQEALGYSPLASLEAGLADYIAFSRSGDRPFRWWDGE